MLTYLDVPRQHLDGGSHGGGAAAAVTSLFQVHYWPMVRLARHLVDDQETAEDVVQDGFLALYRNWHRLDDPQSAVDYLRSAVCNLSRSWIRRRIVRRRIDPQPLRIVPPADETAVSRDEERRMLAALRTLPRRQREVLVLRYYGELSEEEIADTLGIARGSVKTHAARGLRALGARVGSGATE